MSGPGDQSAWLVDPWDPRQLRFFDGREWTSAVAAHPSVPASAPPLQSAATAGQGFPLGQRVLFLRAIPQRADIDVACSVDDEHGQQLAQIRSVSARGYALWDRHANAGAFFTHSAARGEAEYVDVSDGANRPVGRLCRTNSSWQRFRSSAIDMALYAGPHNVGRTRVSVSPRARFAAFDEPIYDTDGGVVATVRRQWRYVDTSVTFYDYSLESVCPTRYPLLMVGVVFAHYLYDRRVVGGPFGTNTNFA